MKLSKLLLLPFMTLTLLTACAQPVQTGIISAKDALDMIEKNDNTILLDVRTPEEYREKRIPGSILLPDYDIKSKAAEVLPDKNVKIIVYCRSGRRSAGAAKTLNQLGYKNVYDMGGIIDWPYETISGD